MSLTPDQTSRRVLSCLKEGRADLLIHSTIELQQTSYWVLVTGHSSLAQEGNRAGISFCGRHKPPPCAAEGRVSALSNRTAARMGPVAATTRSVSGSPANSQPRSTAITGLT